MLSSKSTQKQTYKAIHTSLATIWNELPTIICSFLMPLCDIHAEFGGHCRNQLSLTSDSCKICGLTFCSLNCFETHKTICTVCQQLDCQHMLFSCDGCNQHVCLHCVDVFTDFDDPISYVCNVCSKIILN